MDCAPLAGRVCVSQALQARRASGLAVMLLVPPIVRHTDCVCVVGAPAMLASLVPHVSGLCHDAWLLAQGMDGV